MGRSPCCSKVGMKRGAWTAMEDKILTFYIKAHGEGQWRNLPKRAGLKRCGKSCRLRWMNYLRPDIKRGNISQDEEELILKLHRLLGNRWSLIAGRLPGRTDNEIKNYWNTTLSKKFTISDTTSSTPPKETHNSLTTLRPGAEQSNPVQAIRPQVVRAKPVQHTVHNATIDSGFHEKSHLFHGSYNYDGIAMDPNRDDASFPNTVGLGDDVIMTREEGMNDIGDMTRQPVPENVDYYGMCVEDNLEFESLEFLLNSDEWF